MSTKRILLVDYDSRSLTRHREVLEGAGFQVSTCGDGLSAIDKFKTLAPDLVLLSAMLPKMHGFDVCSKIRKMPGGEKIPVVIITDVYKGKRYRVDAIHKYGATEYIEQPIEDSNLIKVLQSLVQENGRGSNNNRDLPSDLDERTVAFSRDALFSKLTKEQPSPQAIPEKKNVMENLIDEDVSKKLEESLAGLNLQFSKPKTKPKSPAAPKMAPVKPPAPVASPPREAKAPEAPPTLILKKQDPGSGSTFTAEDLFTDIIESVERELEAGRVEMNAVQPVASKVPDRPEPPVVKAPKIEPQPPVIPPISAGESSNTIDRSPIFSGLESIEPQPIELELPSAEAPEAEEADLEPVEEDGIHFGQYLLLSKIATGGMAELYKAKRKGVEGFEKILAIKRILPHMSSHEEFVTMFIDEAKLAAQLTHQNICQIFDLGKIQDSYYITMEYVHGKDLRAILKAAYSKEQSVPIELAILVASKICSALDYAHRKKDSNKQALNLVHRDVSPQNILISYEGDVKLVDFGIAKATNKVHVTQNGALRGKLMYMSPEQAWGRSVDRRADIFSLGLVLYEILTGRPHFYQDSDTEVAVLEKVREARITPIRQINSKVPVELERIISKALKKTPEDRYQSAAELQRDLDSLFYSEGYNATSASLASFVRSLFPQEWGQEVGTRETLMLNKEVSTLLLKATQENTAEPPSEPKMGQQKVDLPPAPPSKKKESSPVTPMAEMEAPIDNTVPPSEVNNLKEILSIHPRQEAPVLSMSEPEFEKRNWLKIAALVAGLAVVVGLIAFYLFRPASPSQGQLQHPVKKVEKALTNQPPASQEATAVTPVPAPVQIQDQQQEQQQEAKKAAEELKQKKAEELRKQEELRAAQEKEEKQKAEELAKLQEQKSVESEKVPAEAKSELPVETDPAPAAQVEEPALTSPVTEQIQPPQQAPIVNKEPEPVPQQTPEAAPNSPSVVEPVVNEGDLVQLTPSVVKPVITSRVDPEYPRLAMGKKLEGTVILSVLVSEKGEPQEVKVLRGAGRSDAFNQAALKAVKQWKFQPAVKAGKRVKVWVTYPIVFKLQ